MCVSLSRIQPTQRNTYSLIKYSAIHVEGRKINTLIVIEMDTCTMWQAKERGEHGQNFQAYLR